MVASKALTMADRRWHVSKAVVMAIADGIIEGEMEGCFEGINDGLVRWHHRRGNGWLLRRQ